MKKNKYLKIVKTIISVGLIGYLLGFRSNLPKLLETVANIKLNLLTAAYIFILLGILLRSWRWKLILKAMEINLRITKLTRLYFIGLFYNNFLPSTVGGDLAKIYKIRQEKGNKNFLTNSVIIDRLLGLITLYILGIFSFYINFNQLSSKIKVIAGIVFGTMTLTFLLILQGKLIKITFNGLTKKLPALNKPLEKMRILYKSFQEFKSSLVKKNRIIHLLLISLTFFFLSSATPVFLLLKSIEITVPFTYLISVLPIISILVMLPISINGMGLRELLLVLFLGPMGVTSETAITTGILIMSINIFNSLIGGILNIVD